VPYRKVGPRRACGVRNPKGLRDARVALGYQSRLFALLFDDEEITLLVDDSVRGRSVPGREQKPRGLGSNVLVLGRPDADDRRTALRVALTEERNRLILHAVGQGLLLDLLVGVAKDRFVLGASLGASPRAAIVVSQVV